MIKKVFSINCDMDVCKVFGHKEVTKEFANEKEAEEFIKKVENKDAKVLEELEEESEVVLDDYSCNEVFDCGEWEVWEEQEK